MNKCALVLNISLVTSAVSLTACGQQDLVLPDSSLQGACGAAYPGSLDSDVRYAVETGAIFPCYLFETAMLKGNSTYINFSELYLQAKHTKIKAKSIVIIISAARCPSCAVFMDELASRVSEFEEADATMIGAVWCDNVDRGDCDFEIERAYAVAEAEGWPTDIWPVTNDAEGHLKPAFSETFPAAVVIRLSDMRVERVDRLPTVDGLLETVENL